MKNLNRQTIQRMIDGRAGSSGGGSSRGADLAGYATEVWVNQNYVSIEFFNQLFNIHGHAADDTGASPTDISVLPNDTESIVDSIETMVGLWTEEYLSALGLNSQGGAGGASALSDLLDVSISSPQNGQVLTYNSATGKWVNATPASPGGVGTVTSVGVSVPTGFSVSNTPVTSSGTIAISFASGYSLPTDAKQSDWDDALILATAISGNFDNVGNAKAANKLTTYSKTAWGQTYWTSGGVPTDVSGNMSSVGDIAFSASGKNIGGMLYFNTTDSQIKVGANATKVSYTQVIGGTTYTYTPKLYIDQSIGVAGSVFTKQIELYGTSGESSSYIDFHYGGSTSDYTARIIESASGIVTISNAVNTAKLYLYKPNAGSDTGAVYLEYDSNNSGIHLVGGGLYADTYISALGANSQQSSSGISMSDVWDALAATAPSTASQQIDVSHLAQALSGLVTTDTKNTAGNYMTTIKLYLIGTQTLSTDSTSYATTFGNQNCYIYNSELYSNGSKVITESTETKNTVGNFNIGSSTGALNALYLVGTAGYSSSQTSYQASSVNSYCYIGTDNCLYSNGSKVLTAAETGFLPLSGGVMTGTINSNARYIIKNKNDRYVFEQVEDGSSGYMCLTYGSTAIDGWYTMIFGRYISLYTGEAGATEEKFRISANGYVGIGTTSPTQKLDVNGSVKATSFIKTNGTSSQFLKADGSVDPNTYVTSDTKNTAGNFNIGSSAGALNALYIVGTAGYSSSTTSYQETSVNSYCYIGTDNCLYSNGSKVLTAAETGFLPLTGGTMTGSITSSAQNIILSKDGYHILEQNTDYSDNYICLAYGTAYYLGWHTEMYGNYIKLCTGAARNLSERMRILANGNVCIGTTTASAKLQVNNASDLNFTSVGNFFAPNLTAGHTSVVTFGKNESAYRNYGYIGYKFSANNNDSNQVSIGFNNADFLFNVLANGNVGIGTQSPTTKLYVDGATTITGNLVFMTGDNGIYGLVPSKSNGWRLNLYTEGASRICVRDTGYVGIGTSSPTYKLTVSGDGYFSGQVYSNGTAVLTSETKNTVGNFNIGSSTGALNALYIVGTATYSSSTSSYEASSVNQYCYIGTDNCLYSNGSKVLTAAETGFLPLTGGTMTGSIRSSATEIMQNKNGRHIIEQNVSGNTSYLCLGYGSSMIDGWYTIMFGNYIGLYTGSVGSPAERLRIATNGNVGIGTTAPSYKLHVAGTGYFTGKVYSEGNEVLTSGNVVTTNTNQTLSNCTKTLYNTILTSNFGAKFESICIACGTDGTVGTHTGEINRFSGDLHLQYDGSYGVTMFNKLRFSMASGNTYLTSNGAYFTITVGSASHALIDYAWVVTSDMRRKDVIMNAGASIEQIADAPIFYYRLKGSPETTLALGSSAQYWQQVFPNAISETPDGFLSMDYSSIALASAVVTARKVQNHEERIRDLENENRELREEIRLLKAA